MKAEQPDSYCYAGTDVLKNLADCRDQHSLDLFEAQVVAFNLAALSGAPITEPFGPDRLRETHRRIFDGVYSWAGEFRENTGRMTKQRDGYAVTYADSAYVNREVGKVFASLAGEQYLQGLDPNTFAERAAHYYGELDAIHPFREGNSRTLRQFASDLALQAGHTLDWSNVASDEQGRKRLYFARDVAVINADSSQLAAIIKMALSPTRGNEHDRSAEMKERLLVMNGQRIVQSEQEPGKWHTEHVDKAGSVKPGIYNIYQAKQADKATTHDGVILHADKQHIYQQVGKEFIKHERADFDKVPEIGGAKSVTYDQSTGRAVVAAATMKLGRGHSR